MSGRVTAWPKSSRRSSASLTTPARLAHPQGDRLDSPVPITRAIQRDEEEIQRWRDTVWPELKRRARRQRRTLVFVDESGFYLLPGVVKTYGLKGHTPVVMSGRRATTCR